MPEPEIVEPEASVDHENAETEGYEDPEVVAHSDDSDDGPCLIVGSCGVNSAE